jgi:hypothetical protein
MLGVRTNEVYVMNTLAHSETLRLSDTGSQGSWHAFVVLLPIFISPNRLYAIALIDAYRAYGNSTHLDDARATWKTMQNMQITDQDVAFGSHNGTAISTSCRNGRPDLVTRVYEKMKTR